MRLRDKIYKCNKLALGRVLGCAKGAIGGVKDAIGRSLTHIGGQTLRVVFLQKTTLFGGQSPLCYRSLLTGGSPLRYRSLLTIFCMCAMLCTGKAYAGDEYMSQRWDVEDGLTQNTVTCILQDKQGFMWFGTWDGLNRFDGYEFTDYRPKQVDVNSRVEELYEDRDETLWWMSYDGCFYSMSREREEILEHPQEDVPEGLLKKIQKRSDTLAVDSHGIIWKTDEKAGILRNRDGKWKRFVPEQDKRFAGATRREFMMLTDSQGRDWFNPTGGGFGYYDYENDVFVNPLRMTSTIHRAYIDNDGMMWLSTYDKGIECLNFEEQPFVVHDLSVWNERVGEVRAMCQLADGRMLIEPKDERMVLSIAETPRGVLYGTRNNGLQYSNGRPAPYVLNDPCVTDILVVGDTLAVATRNGLNIFLPTGERKLIAEGEMVRCLELGEGNVIYAGTSKGLMIIRGEEVTYVAGNVIHCMKLMADGLYVGTYGGGLFKLEHDGENYVLAPRPTGERIVLAMAGAGDMLWMTSETSITQYNCKTGEHRHFVPLEKTRSAYLTEAKACLRTDGVVLFGFNQGYIEFDPAKVKPLNKTVPLRLMSLSVMGKPRKMDVEPIRMKYGEGAFTVSFAALEYADPDHIEYAYKLDGLDKDWCYDSKDRKKTYSNLSPGKYTFRVRSTNRAGEWVDNEQTLRLVVEQSLWLSWWAFVIYFLLLCGLLMLAAYLSRRYERLKQEINKGEEVNKAKLQFFTNISHELRTPLTLISAPVENILKNEKLSDSLRQQLEIVDNNSKRMLRMVNQILDFRKIQNDKMRLKIQLASLKDVAEGAMRNFEKEAQDRHINLELVCRTENHVVWMDCQNMDTVVFNLLSNSFKYSEDGKSIRVIIDERPGYALLAVQDEGAGIPKDRQQHLFERFNSNTDLSTTSKTGTGIGLHLAKEIVDLHHGFIELDSTIGKGTTITVILRRGRDHFGSETDMMVDDRAESSVPTPKTGVDVVSERGKKMLMVVDDNDDMRSFLQSLLVSEYDVLTAKDGAIALPMVTKHQPDLVITDLMMPNMDGLELTNRLKKSDATGHIPVILLTAKSAIESRLDALEYGADDYITKPFEPEYLRARVKNIISQRDNLEKTYRERLLRLEPQKEETNTDAFLTRLMAIMDKEMDNNALTVDDLVEEVGLGRTVFFNKLKSLTGLSPVEFIREIRIKRAAQLLKDPQYNISEVTYMIGMNDARYFSKCFKQTYGVTPTEYRKRESKTDENEK